MKRQGDAGDFTTAMPLFARPVEGPFDRSKLPPTTLETLVAGLIWKHQGRENPISIARLTEVTGIEARGVKGLVADLILGHNMRIGSRRVDPVGYFIICDAADIEAGTGAYWSQFIEMAKRLRVLDPDRMGDLYGQLPLEAGR